MQAEKVLLARALKPLRKEPPYMCRRDKTIRFDTFGRTLTIFKDTRPEAVAYVKEVLPTLLTDMDAQRKAMNLFNSLDAQWLEFDFTTNLLHLCSIKKS